MFKAVHGVSTVEFLKQGMSQEAFGQTLALPELTPSDAGVRERPRVIGFCVYLQKS